MLANEKSWYVIYTRYRFERKVIRQLSEHDIQYFFPTNRVLRTWTDRRKYAEEPLFPSYVFVHANTKERFLAEQPNGVISLVYFGGRPAVIPQAQIDSIRFVLESGEIPEPCDYINVGDRVEVIAGPLAGLTGLLTQNRGQRRFLLNIDNIQKSLAVVVEPSYLRLLN